VIGLPARLGRRQIVPSFGVCAVVVAVIATQAWAGGWTFAVGPVTEISASCAGRNAEVEQAADPSRGYVYEAWMGCNGIGFTRSTDAGRTFAAPTSLSGAVGLNVKVRDPAVAVGPDGTVYVAFMAAKNGQQYPVVATSFDQGQTFTQVSELVPPDAANSGDRDFIAVGPDNSVYVTWNYGPSRGPVTTTCDRCGFASGDFNVVIQKSSDHGKTFGPMHFVSPGFPASGGDSGPMVVERNGRIDVLYQGYRITDTTTYALAPAYSYFTSSNDGGASWSKPIRLGPNNGTMALAEWWIDGDIAIDAAGNLYAVWDTQGKSGDLGWLSYSTDHGAHWSSPRAVPPDRLHVAHVMEVAGGSAGIAYVSFFSASSRQGYADYLRVFSIRRGFLTTALRISPDFGDSKVWPGDTFGLSSVAPSEVVLSWGSATTSSGGMSEIFAANVAVEDTPAPRPARPCSATAVLHTRVGPSMCRAVPRAGTDRKDRQIRPGAA
jgi:hypothetical protein